MDLRFSAIAAALLASTVFAPLAAATDAPDLPPAGVCVDQVTHDGCWRENWICVGFSYQVPQCVEHVTIVCGVPCDLDVSELPDPCETEYFDCVCQVCDLPVEPASRSGPEPMCMYYYYEMDTGVVRYVARDSCHSEIYVNGERIK